MNPEGASSSSVKRTDAEEEHERTIDEPVSDIDQYGSIITIVKDCIDDELSETPASLAKLHTDPDNLPPRIMDPEPFTINIAPSSPTHIRPYRQLKSVVVRKLMRAARSKLDNRKM